MEEIHRVDYISRPVHLSGTLSVFWGKGCLYPLQWFVTSDGGHSLGVNSEVPRINKINVFVHTGK